MAIKKDKANEKALLNLKYIFIFIKLLAKKIYKTKPLKNLGVCRQFEKR